jgi:hypothetical protein
VLFAMPRRRAGVRFFAMCASFSLEPDGDQGAAVVFLCPRRAFIRGSSAA